MFYAFIAPGELAAHHDPVRVLRMAATRADLLAHAVYDPEHISPWARAAVVEVEAGVHAIRNEKTGQDETAKVCRMDTP